MKSLFLLGIALCLVTSLAFAQYEETTTTTAAPEASAPAAIEITINGTIIDNHCAANQTPQQLAEFVKTHTKECALMPMCATSGYSIFADGKLTKFDQASSAKVEEFLKKADSKLNVTVTANKVGDELSLVTIANQK